MDIAGHLEIVVQALVEGAAEEARAALQAIDQPAEVSRRAEAYRTIWGPDGSAKRARPHQPAPYRGQVSRRVRQQVFERDCYTCRYGHCQRRTVSLSVLRNLSRIFDDLLPFHKNWRPLNRHILYWSYSTSLEHHIPLSHNDSNQMENLLTSCYECNDLKNRLHPDDLGWSFNPPSTSQWRGLTEYEPSLSIAVNNLGRA